MDQQQNEAQTLLLDAALRRVMEAAPDRWKEHHVMFSDRQTVPYSMGALTAILWERAHTLLRYRAESLLRGLGRTLRYSQLALAPLLVKAFRAAIVAAIMSTFAWSVVGTVVVVAAAFRAMLDHAFRYVEAWWSRSLVKAAAPLRPSVLLARGIALEDGAAYVVVDVEGREVRVRVTNEQALMAKNFPLHSDKTNSSKLEMAVSEHPKLEAPTPDAVVKIVANGRVAGFGFRVGDDLYTAAHVLQSVRGYPSISIISSRGLQANLEKKWPLTLRVEGLDVAAVGVPRGIWANLGVKTLTIVKAKQSQLVYVPGLNAVGAPCMSYGNIQTTDKLFVFNHNCSTQRGDSGSPVLTSRGVVGVHRGVAPSGELNEATALDFLIQRESASTSEQSHGHAYKEVEDHRDRTVRDAVSQQIYDEEREQRRADAMFDAEAEDRERARTAGPLGGLRERFEPAGTTYTVYHGGRSFKMTEHDGKTYSFSNVMSNADFLAKSSWADSEEYEDAILRGHESARSHRVLGRFGGGGVEDAFESGEGFAAAPQAVVLPTSSVVSSSAALALPLATPPEGATIRVGSADAPWRADFFSHQAAQALVELKSCTPSVKSVGTQTPQAPIQGALGFNELVDASQSKSAKRRLRKSPPKDNEPLEPKGSEVSFGPNVVDVRKKQA